MAARRLVIVMLVLLGISTLAAILVEPPETEQDQEAATEPPPPTPPRGELIRERISADDHAPATISMRVGDQLALTVTSRRADQVEIPALGELRFAAPLAPARFDLLAREKGRYAIRLVEADRTIGRIEVMPRRDRDRPMAGRPGAR